MLQRTSVRGPASAATVVPMGGIDKKLSRSLGRRGGQTSGVARLQQYFDRFLSKAVTEAGKRFGWHAGHDLYKGLKRVLVEAATSLGGTSGAGTKRGAKRKRKERTAPQPVAADVPTRKYLHTDLGLFGARNGRSTSVVLAVPVAPQPPALGHQPTASEPPSIVHTPSLTSGFEPEPAPAHSGMGLLETARQVAARTPPPDEHDDGGITLDC